VIKLADALTSGDHVCAVPDSTEHLGELAAAYVAHGLDRGERILYFDDDGAADVLLRRLVEDGASRKDRYGPRPTSSTQNPAELFVKSGPAAPLSRKVRLGFVHGLA